MTITITELVKDYGKFRALDHINLEIGTGMFGLLGPNGAGKTTLMKIMTTLLQPTAGQVLINGHDVVRDPQAIRHNLGFVPQYFGFYKGLNAYQMLDYIGVMKGLSKTERKLQIADLLQKVNLTDDAKRKVSGYSGGMKQRLAIAQAMLGNPSLLIVDEPTAGLDPEERIRFRNLLTRLSGDRTIVLSTHIVADIEASCNAVAVLKKGAVIFDGHPDLMVRRAEGCVWELQIDSSDYERVDAHYNVVASRADGNGLTLRIIAGERPADATLIDTPTLEDGYMAVMADLEPAVPVVEAEVSYA